MSNRSYSFKAVQLVIGGIAIQGIAEGGISFEMLADASETEVGIDGETATSFIADERVRCTVALMATSASNAALMGLYRAQQEAVDNGIERPPLPFLMVDTINGDEIPEPQAVFERIPGPNKAQASGVREWTFLLPRARRALILAATRI